MRLRPALACLVLAAVLLLAPGFARAAPPGLITKRSAFDVAQTIERLTEQLKQAGFTILAHIDQRAVAAKGGEHIPAAELLLFSYPDFDAALLKSDRIVGLELPLRALAWEDTSGRVSLTYPSPDRLAQRFDITNQPVAIEHMGQLLDKLTDKAVQP